MFESGKLRLGQKCLIGYPIVPHLFRLMPEWYQKRKGAGTFKRTLYFEQHRILRYLLACWYLRQVSLLTRQSLRCMTTEDFTISAARSYSKRIEGRPFSRTSVTNYIKVSRTPPNWPELVTLYW